MAQREIIKRQEHFEDTKEVIRSRKPKNDRQGNGQKKKNKHTNNGRQNNTLKTKDRQLHQKPGRNSCVLEEYEVTASLLTTVV